MPATDPIGCRIARNLFTTVTSLLPGRVPAEKTEALPFTTGRSRRAPKEDAVSHGIIIRHKPHDEVSAINVQCISPNPIIVRRYPAPTVLKLGNDGVIFESYLVGQFPLRQATPFAQMAQPVAGLNAQIPGSR